MGEAARREYGLRRRAVGVAARREYGYLDVIMEAFAITSSYNVLESSVLELHPRGKGP